MSDKNKSLMKKAKESVEKLFCDTSVSLESSIKNMEEIVGDCETNIQCAIEDIEARDKE